MIFALLLLPAVLSQSPCSPACTDAEKCVECNGKNWCIPRDSVFTCGSTTVTCSADCNGAARPTISTVPCWDNSLLEPLCDLGSCKWVSSTCPRDPCHPSPCRATDKCCVPTRGNPCSAASPPAAGTPYVCIPTNVCECVPLTTIAVESTKCFDGSIGGHYCFQEAGGTCSWKVRTCPTDPCHPSPCLAGQTCLVTTATLGTSTTTGAASICTNDRCANIVCAGLAKCFNGECVCDASLATRSRVLCPDGHATPVFNNDPRVCQYVDRPCADPTTPPVCPNGQVVINLATEPKCVPDTDPCVNPTPVTCRPGLTCRADPLSPTKPACVCTKCPENGIRASICYNGEPSQKCDLETCEFVPNPDCSLPDPCSTTKCQDGFRCVNMGSGIVAGPMCVPRDPCNPNPCTDAKTVCRAAISVSTSSNVGGAASFAEAKAYICVPVSDPSPTTCDPNPCKNEGICYKSERGAPVCRCQKGWTGQFCQNLDCEGCSQTSTQQCRTPNAVLSNDGTSYKESCVCNEIRIRGDACNIVESGTDGKASPEVIVPTRGGTDSRASITGTEDTSFQIRGGQVDSKTEDKFDGEPIVVELDRLDGDGKPTQSGPLPKGKIARVKICSKNFVATKEPDLFLVELAGLKDSKKICAEINTDTTVPSSVFVAPNCWVISVCHASTYAAGTPVSPSANTASGMTSLTIAALGFGLLAL